MVLLLFVRLIFNCFVFVILKVDFPDLGIAVISSTVDSQEDVPIASGETQHITSYHIQNLKKIKQKMKSLNSATICPVGTLS